jgi:hypothetical protein
VEVTTNDYLLLPYLETKNRDPDTEPPREKPEVAQVPQASIAAVETNSMARYRAKDAGPALELPFYDRA